jgi:5-hydroxyisourate hydrolase
MNTITTHVLDTSSGRPAAGIPISLERENAPGEFVPVAQGIANDDGRVKDLLPPGDDLASGTYRMTFDTAMYFQSTLQEGFYPVVHVQFTVRSTDQHYHIPLLLSPYGYSTYRGS